MTISKVLYCFNRDTAIDKTKICFSSHHTSEATRSTGHRWLVAYTMRMPALVQGLKIWASENDKLQGRKPQATLNRNSNDVFKRDFNAIEP